MGYRGGKHLTHNGTSIIQVQDITSIIKAIDKHHQLGSRVDEVITNQGGGSNK